MIRKELPKVNKNINIIEFDLNTGNIHCMVLFKNKIIAQGNLKSIFVDLYKSTSGFEPFLKIWNILDGTVSYATPQQERALESNPDDPEKHLDSLNLLYDNLEGKPYRYNTIPLPLPKKLIEDIINL
jgi:hypothetical protein